jgi:hypothetical protein
MTRVAPFHSINESRRGAPRYHTNDLCERALAIPPDDLRPGSGGFYVCEICRAMREQEELEEARVFDAVEVERIQVIEEGSPATTEAGGSK